MKNTTIPKAIQCVLVPAAVALLASCMMTTLAVGNDASPASHADPLDWTYWRGPGSDGSSTETGLIDSFDFRTNANVSWHRDDLGGRSTPIVMGGKLYTLLRADPETPREGERVVCLDAATGETIWENRFNVWLSDVPDTRVGWSSVVGDPQTGNVYALGVCGFFQCLDGDTGKRIWSVPLHEKFGLLSTYGGRTNFPILCDDLVIISAIVIGWGDMAKPAHRFIGFDKRTGEVRWFKGTRLLPYDTNYSAPTLTVLNGQKAMVFGSGDGQVWALQPRTGQPIWNYSFSKRGLNTAPLVVGETIFMGHSEENLNTTAMGCVVAINGASQGNITRSGELWRADGVMVGKCGPLVIGDRLVCLDDRAKLRVFSTKNGESMGRAITVGGTAARSSPLYADGKVFAFSTSAWAVLTPDKRRGLKVIHKGRLPRGEEVYASPICSHGNLYLQTTSALYCLRDKSKQQTSSQRSAPAAELAVAEDPKPAYVQLVPAEILVRPGDQRGFRARLFNSRGQFLREAEAEFSLEGPGQIDGDGQFTAAGERHSAATVTARVGDLVGSSRIRTVPDLPWSFDFTGLDDLPITWVGARYRHVLREVDGDPAMVKVNTIPKGTRSRCWFGHPDLQDYTIQADVRGDITNEKMPDIGLIAQGYTLALMGAHQKLQVRTWVTQERMARSVPFAWEPNKWYTIKLQAANAGDKVVVRGKVWPRGEPEPTAWTVEATDDSPNVQGSPGLYGDANDAEITLDNIRVFPNG